MPWPRFRIRTLMLTVAVAAVGIWGIMSARRIENPGLGEMATTGAFFVFVALGSSLSLLLETSRKRR